MRYGPSSLAAGAAFLLAAAASAQVPAGPPFQVNSYTTGRQAYPDVAMKAGGDFVVVWDHRVQFLTTPSDVHARRYTSTGTPIGDEFRVNVFTTSAQTIVAAGGVRLDGRGNALVVWDDFRSLVGAFGRRMSAAGALLGGDLSLSPFNGSIQAFSRFAVAPSGRFVVVWEDLGAYDLFARRYDAFGAPLGSAFRVNTFTTNKQMNAGVAMDPAGNFTVVWESYAQDDPVQASVFGQRFDASGGRIGGEFQVNSYATGVQGWPSIAAGRDGGFIVVWEGDGPGSARYQVWARRFASSGAPLGAEFALVDAAPGEQAMQVSIALDEPGNFVVAWAHYAASEYYSTIRLRRYNADGTPRGGNVVVASPSAAFVSPRVASDPAGNFVVAWHASSATDRETIARRFGGLFPAALTVADQDDGVLEVGDAFVLRTSWRNGTGAAQAFQGDAGSVAVPSGLSLTLSSTLADYGTVADGATAVCGTSCIAGDLAGTRPSGHVDGSLVERIAPDVQGQAKRWLLHIGESFTDVPRTSPFYRFVETLLHRSVTSGCGGTGYCPAAATTREQMAPFLLVAKEGAGYAPVACGATPLFADVPVSSPFCPFVEELARRGVVVGCGGGNYCPAAPVTREQMSVFVLRTLDGTFTPPPCTTPPFDDVPPTSPFCPWIQELALRGIVNGCGGGNYCPAAAVTREQMSVFISATFGLTLYGP